MASEWTPVGDATSIPLDTPLIVAWSSYPWYPDHRPYVADRPYSLRAVGEFYMWMFLGNRGRTDWDKAVWPTHYQLWPSPPDPLKFYPVRGYTEEMSVLNVIHSGFQKSGEQIEKMYDDLGLD